jgi:hypothetical protein
MRKTPLTEQPARGPHEGQAGGAGVSGPSIAPTLTNREVHDRWPKCDAYAIPGDGSSLARRRPEAMLTDISHARTQLVRAFEYPEAPMPELVELYFSPRRQQATRLPTGRSG